MNNFSVRVISEPESKRLNIIFDGVDSDAETLISSLLTSALGKPTLVETAQGLKPMMDTREYRTSDAVTQMLASPRPDKAEAVESSVTEPVQDPAPAPAPAPTPMQAQANGVTEQTDKKTSKDKQPSVDQQAVANPASNETSTDPVQNDRIYLKGLSYDNKGKAMKLAKESGGFVSWDASRKTWWASSLEIAKKVIKAGYASAVIK